MFSVGLLGATFVPKIVGNLSAGATRAGEPADRARRWRSALFVISLFLGMTGAPAGQAPAKTIVTGE